MLLLGCSGTRCGLRVESCSRVLSGFVDDYRRSRCNVQYRRMPFSGRVDGAVDALNFERGIERFGQRIVETYPGPADRAAQVEVGKCDGEIVRRILASAV